MDADAGKHGIAGYHDNIPNDIFHRIFLREPVCGDFPANLCGENLPKGPICYLRFLTAADSGFSADVQQMAGRA